MINILIPLAGKTVFFDTAEYPFPKPLIEICGKPMIELLIGNFMAINKERKFIFIVNQSDCEKYHLDNTLKLLTDYNCEIIKVSGETKGAACSVLLAVEYINNDNELVISNGDQLIDRDLNEVLEHFEKRKVDAGVICFESVHPKWSYVQLDEDGKIMEMAEKRPISKNAIAGFYYFRQGCDFVNSAMKSIEKGASVNGIYYIAPTFNELILENKHLEIFRIESSQYHSFYSPQKISEYEKIVKDKL